MSVEVLQVCDNRTKWQRETQEDSKLQVGKLVAFFDNATGGGYQLSTIIDTKRGLDQQIRSVCIEYKRGTRAQQTTRSVRMIVVL